jgi:apolipoprotein D and lipocalin family protein
MSIRNTLLTLSGIALVSACQAANPPLETVDYVDLERFMGDWYVIANIPTFVEKGAHNAVESYRLDEDGTIATTFTFRKDSFDGKEKTYNPRGFVRDTETNAEWGMQFVWPIKGDYRIIYLSEDYSTTIIGRNKRDYVWLMAREYEMPDAEYQKAVQFIADAGYDISQLQRVPQQW